MSEHSWRKHEREGWTICVRCGLVRNYDRPDSQCRGAAKIALREATGGEPTCDLECATCRYQIDPTHCADAVSGEQGPSADELEISRLRRERIEQESVSLEMGGEIARLRRELDEALALRDRLSTIVDEAFGLQEVLDTDALLSRLEHLLTERAHERLLVLAERDEARVALRDLIASVEATKTRNTIVLRDLEAARAVLGGQP